MILNGSESVCLRFPIGRGRGRFGAVEKVPIVVSAPLARPGIVVEMENGTGLGCWANRGTADVLTVGIEDISVNPYD